MRFVMSVAALMRMLLPGGSLTQAWCCHRWCSEPGRNADVQSATAQWTALAHLCAHVLCAHLSSLPQLAIAQAESALHQMLQHALHGQRNGTRYDSLPILICSR